MHLDILNAVFIKLIAIEKIALIDNDFYKSSSSSGQKMHLDTLNAVL
jgi:hypothetical protein